MMSGDHSSRAESAGLLIFADDDFIGIAKARLQLANFSRSRQDLDSAANHYDIAAKQFRAAGDATGAAQATWGLGEVARARGDLGAAEEYLRSALGIYEDIDDRLGRANTCWGLGEVARARGDLGAAEEYLRSAQIIAADIGAVDLAQTISSSVELLRRHRIGTGRSTGIPSRRPDGEIDGPEEDRLQTDRGELLEPVTRYFDDELMPISASENDHLGSSPDAERARIEGERLLADQGLFNRMEAVGFSGPLYDEFIGDLVRYGLAVMHAWISSGRIFQLLEYRQVLLRPTDQEWSVLRTDPSVRSELADSTIASTLQVFQERALYSWGWRAESGMSLSTYFMSMAVLRFPNHYRSWRRQHSNWMRLHSTESAELERVPPMSDPATHVAENLEFQQFLQSLPECDRQLLLLKSNGYSTVEIAEICGLTSHRAVEGRLMRIRKKLIARREET
jgi:DNA-directed RNA polymerase specialized sigma24 family protein